MTTKLLLTLTLTLALFSPSCTASRSLYRVTYLDTDFFDYDIVRLESTKGDEFILLSKRQDSLKAVATLPGFEVIQLGASYWLTLRKLPAPPELRIMLRSEFQFVREYSIYDERFDGEDTSFTAGTLFWRDRKIVKPVYESPDILDRFARIGLRSDISHAADTPPQQPDSCFVQVCTHNNVSVILFNRQTCDCSIFDGDGFILMSVVGDYELTKVLWGEASTDVDHTWYTMADLNHDGTNELLTAFSSDNTVWGYLHSFSFDSSNTVQLTTTPIPDNLASQIDFDGHITLSGDSIIIHGRWNDRLQSLSIYYDLNKDTIAFKLTEDTTTEPLLRQTLDDIKLESFFHPDQPGRHSLCIYGPALPPNLSLEKFGRPVTVVNSPDNCKNCLIIDTIIVADTTARLTLRYPIEGLRGEFSFTRTTDNWTLTSSNLTEK